MESKKVFISYSHTSEKHKEAVRSLATQLSSNGIYVKLDEWDVVGGNDFPTYMEKSINEVDKVLIICDKRYSENADKRSGGVGIETYLISPEVYAKHDQSKFVALVYEKNELGEPYLPAYIKTRKYYDFSSQESQIYEFEMLLRDIFNVPKFSRPPLGVRPVFVSDYDEDDPKAKYNGYYSLERISLSKLQENNSHTLLKRFTELIKKTFSENLIKYDDFESNPHDLMFNKIQEFEDILRVFINVFESTVADNNDFLEDLINLFETMSSFDGKIPEGTSTLTEGMWDHFYFLRHEFFIYSILILKLYSKHEEIAKLLKTNFYCKRKFEKEGFFQFTEFNKYCKSFDYRKSKYQLNRLSVQADTMFERAGRTKFGAAMVVETDLLLGYYSEILFEGEIYKWWFPRMYIYYHRFNTMIFGKMKSKRHLTTLLKELGLSTTEELIQALEKVKINGSENSRNRGYSSSFDSVPTLEMVLDPKVIGTID